MNFVDSWGWRDNLKRQARQGNSQLVQAIELYDRAWSMRETDPNATLSLLMEGRDLAEQLHELWLILFYDYWQCNAYLYYLRDYDKALDLSVRLSVEVQKPIYRDCPLQCCIYMKLATAYHTLDPIGYAEQITQTLDYIEKELPVDKDTWRSIEGERAELAYVLGRFDESEKLTLSYIARCESEPFRLREAYDRLCELSYKRRDFNKSMEYALLGEEVSRKANARLSSVQFLAWQALLHRKLGNEPDAQRLYRTATSNIQWFGAQPADSYYYILREFHEAKANYTKALDLERERLEHALKAGSPYLEAWARYDVCRLLVKLHEPVRGELALAKATAQKLKDPRSMLKKLNALELQTFGSSEMVRWLSRSFDKLISAVPLLRGKW